MVGTSSRSSKWLAASTVRTFEPPSAHSLAANVQIQRQLPRWTRSYLCSLTPPPCRAQTCDLLWWRWNRDRTKDPRIRNLMSWNLLAKGLELTQTALSKLWAKGVDSSFSFPDGRADQKKSLHSLSSKMYGIILVKSLTQFRTVCCSAAVLQLLSTAFTSLSVAL